jgi:hypothetical protein
MAHPEVTTVFVSGHAWWRGPQPSDQQAVYASLVNGYMAAWTALPDSVRQVVAIRDVPFDYVRTPDCVRHEAALRRRPPGVACAIPRARAIGVDPAMVAVARLESARVALVDLTHYFCGARRCFPVVGGVLVHGDIDHLTRLFASTLGPYLLADVDRLIPR